jgi:hypothetical protein
VEVAPTTFKWEGMQDRWPEQTPSPSQWQVAGRDSLLPIVPCSDRMPRARSVRDHRRFGQCVVEMDYGGASQEAQVLR